MHSILHFTKMADPRKPANSSMIDLKAELFRKQEEYKQLKAENSSEFLKGVKSNKISKGDKIWSQKNAGVLQRASRDLEQKQEEDNVMDRSRRALEAKSKIYEKIASASGIPEEDGSEGYLVDFQRKAVDRIGGGGSDDDLSNEEPVPLPSDPSEEWVDYVDTFGRSRRCMKRDLPRMEKQQQPLARSVEDAGLRLKEGATLLSADMKRELRRQQWEKEAEQSADGPVHYANVQFDEIRTHGTGFYQFSKDSNLREEQMEELNKLREQTLDGRQRSERIKEKRKTALQARLAKVKQRRKMKDGGAPIDLEDKKEEEKKGAAEDSTPQEAEPLTRDDSWRRDAPVREWDVGKEKLPEWNAKRYMDQRRGERESEFAPPQIYFDRKKTMPLPPVGTPRGHSARPVVKPMDQSAPPGHPKAGHGQCPPISVPAPSHTDAWLKQIRQNVAHTDTQPAGVDLGSIPLPPQMGPGDSGSVINVEEPRQDAGMVVKDDETGETSIYQVRQQMESAGVVPGEIETLHQVSSGQHSTFCGPVPSVTMPDRSMPDMSMPPPGYQPPQLWGHPESSVVPPAQSLQPSFTASSCLPAERDSSMGAAFVYPSQHGLLSSQPQHNTPPVSTDTNTQRRYSENRRGYTDNNTLSSQQQRKYLEKRKEYTDTNTSLSQKQRKYTHTAHSSADDSSSTKAPGPKVGMVDKRFMQNREVSEEDLLGYMARTTSDDPLTKVQPVSYTPGLFSAAAGSALHRPPSDEKAATSNSRMNQAPSEEAIATSETFKPTDKASQPANQASKPAGQTEGVIFGVPEFLQPAAVAATSYQPGSFMAAKEAAAQRVEEAYAEARKKRQYSSAPVLYGRPDDDDDAADGSLLEQTGEGSGGSRGGKASGTPQTEPGDEEYAQFMRDMRGGK
ncbi:hypothetical protein ACOMHN_047078 [Nucella lapillus]